MAKRRGDAGGSAPKLYNYAQQLQLTFPHFGVREYGMLLSSAFFSEMYPFSVCSVLSHNWL